MPKEFTPSVNMSSSARFVGQGHIFDCPVLGKLTDRKIKKYQSQGKYDGVRRETEKKLSRKKSHKLHVKSILDQIL